LSNAAQLDVLSASPSNSSSKVTRHPGVSRHMLVLVRGPLRGEAADVEPRVAAVARRRILIVPISPK
jgi:hypothetical protein